MSGDGFEFLGYKIKRGQRKLHLPESKIRSQVRQGALYAYPKEKSIRRFMDQVRQQTKRTCPSENQGVDRGGLTHYCGGGAKYYKRAHVRKLFHRLDGWIRRRIWSHRYKHWRNVAGRSCLCPSFMASTSCPLDQLNSFSRIPASLSLRESCMRENRTCSLSGGRRLARKRASSDPTAVSPYIDLPDRHAIAFLRMIGKRLALPHRREAGRGGWVWSTGGRH